MTNELVVNVTPGESRIARLENGAVTELYIERARESGIVGNIYKGKVVRVLPGMQAAFIEIGLDRTAFIHASDALPPELVATGEFSLPLLKDSDEETSGEVELEDAGEGDDAEEGEAPADKEAPGKDAGKRKGRGRKRPVPRNTKIQDLIKEGKEIIVQVTKEPMGTKGARLTSYCSLPGRYLVFMPTVNHIGVSRRIGDDKERRRLKDLINKHRPEGAGFIVRTASEGVTDEDIIADIKYLTKTWAEIDTKSAQSKPPALLHAELDVTLRVVRDLFTADIDRLVIDSPTEHERIQHFVHTFMPEMKQSVELYDGNEPLFDKYGIEVEVTRALGRKVWLKSGGYIIIERTEALTAIDVNTGRFVGKRNVGDTILKTNLEAVKEIVYQLRLRNIGGIIILDFIDMERMNDRTKVYNALKEQLKSDRAKTNITKISELGLVEMTRKRTREEIQRVLTDPCPYCEGKGYLKSPQTIIYEIFREIAREARHFKGRNIHVAAHPTVTGLMMDEERSFMEILEKSLKRRIMIKAHPDYHLEQYEVVEKP